MSSVRRRLRQAARPLAGAARALATGYTQAAGAWRTADLAIFHQFAPPPGGGGHQFLRALWGELARRGLRLENNAISHTTRAVLFNSFNFDFDRLRRLARPGVHMVHRVDGPIGVYRGRDDGADGRIWALNRELAAATVFQSEYSLNKHRELGMEFCSPVVITNAADPAIFFPGPPRALDPLRRVRLIATSWSDNPNKGAAVFQWLDEHLDRERYEFTFVGRIAAPLRHARLVPPQPSVGVAELLRSHDVYISASRHEACSNALLEALACGLPALYVRSGSNGELVGEAGFGFDAAEEIPALLDRLVDEYAARQAAIAVPSLAEVAGRYAQVLGLA